MSNLHDFQHQVYLGYIPQTALGQKQTSFEVSFIGGSPLWLYEPNYKLLSCQSQECGEQLKQVEFMTFLCQIFCPLNAKHCYNRSLYVFYCQKCRRGFKCIKQQTDQNWTPETQQKIIEWNQKIKKISNQSFQLVSQPIQRKQLLKIINRAKIQVQEQIILQRQDEQNQSDDDEGQIISVQKVTGEDYLKYVKEIQKSKKQKQYTDKQIEQINKKFQELKMNKKDQKQEEKQIQNKKTDEDFEQYRKVIKALTSPVLMYSNIAIPYNKIPLNPRHTCKHCNMKLSLQIQITQQILSFQKTLALMDWGSLFIYTCTGSCLKSQQQQIVVQYELDAISEQQLNKMKKTKKQKKNIKKKSISKEKKRNQSKGKDNKIQSENIQNTQQKQDQEGDWD